MLILIAVKTAWDKRLFVHRISYCKLVGQVLLTRYVIKSYEFWRIFHLSTDRLASKSFIAEDIRVEVCWLSNWKVQTHPITVIKSNWHFPICIYSYRYACGLLDVVRVHLTLITILCSCVISNRVVCSTLSSSYACIPILDVCLYDCLALQQFVWAPGISMWVYQVACMLYYTIKRFLFVYKRLLVRIWRYHILTYRPSTCREDLSWRDAAKHLARGFECP